MQGVSIHAPTRGATSAQEVQRQRRAGFNPRPHARGDMMSARQSVRRLFQSTPPREGRHVCLDDIPAKIGFQSTPPREGRLTGGWIVRRFSTFQSTPPREGRHRRVVWQVTFKKFQSTPPREGRQNRIYNMSRVCGFNPRPHARGDNGHVADCTTRICFNPRPHARGDPLKITPLHHLVSRRHYANRPGFYRPDAIKTTSTQLNLCKSSI